MNRIGGIIGWLSDIRSDGTPLVITVVMIEAHRVPLLVYEILRVFIISIIFDLFISIIIILLYYQYYYIWDFRAEHLFIRG